MPKGEHHQIYTPKSTHTTYAEKVVLRLLRPHRELCRIWWIFTSKVELSSFEAEGELQICNLENKEEGEVKDVS